jgi:hypothetical protein
MSAAIDLGTLFTSVDLRLGEFNKHFTELTGKIRRLDNLNPVLTPRVNGKAAEETLRGLSRTVKTEADNQQRHLYQSGQTTAAQYKQHLEKRIGDFRAYSRGWMVIQGQITRVEKDAARESGRIAAEKKRLLDNEARHGFEIQNRSLTAHRRYLSDKMAAEKRYSAEFMKLARERQGVDEQIRSNRRELTQRVATGAVVAGAAGIAASWEVAKTGAAYDKQARYAATNLSLTPAQVEKLKQQVLEISKDRNILSRPEDLMAGVYSITGTKRFSNLGPETMDMLRQGAYAATAGNTDLKTALDPGLGAMGARLKGAEDPKKTFDSLFKGAQIGKMEFSHLTGLGELFVHAKQMDVSLQEIMAALAMFTSQSLPVSQSATALTQYLTHIKMPSVEARHAMDALGVKHGSRALEGTNLADYLSDMRGRLIAYAKTHKSVPTGPRGSKPISSPEDLLAVIMPDIQGQTGGSILLGDSRVKVQPESYRSYVRDLSTASQGRGAMQSALDLMAGGPSADWDRLLKTFDRIKISLSGGVLPGMERFAGWIETWTGLFEKLPKGAQANIGAGALAGSVALAAGGTLTLATKGLKEFFDLFKDSALGGRIKGIGGVFGAVFGGVKGMFTWILQRASWLSKIPGFGALGPAMTAAAVLDLGAKNHIKGSEQQQRNLSLPNAERIKFLENKRLEVYENAEAEKARRRRGRVGMDPKLAAKGYEDADIDRSVQRRVAEIDREIKILKQTQTSIRKASDSKNTYGHSLPHVVAAGREIEALFGVTNIGGRRSAASSRDKHGHPAGRALDVMVGNTAAGKAKGDKIAEHALANQKRLGVQYVIWRQKINSGDGRGWRPMADRGNPTLNHMDHPHINFLPTAPKGAAGGAGAPSAPGAGGGYTFPEPPDTAAGQKADELRKQLRKSRQDAAETIAQGALDAARETFATLLAEYRESGGIKNLARLKELAALIPQKQRELAAVILGNAEPGQRPAAEATHKVRLGEIGRESEKRFGILDQAKTRRDQIAAERKKEAEEQAAEEAEARREEEDELMAFLAENQQIDLAKYRAYLVDRLEATKQFSAEYRHYWGLIARIDEESRKDTPQLHVEHRKPFVYEAGHYGGPARSAGGADQGAEGLAKLREQFDKGKIGAGQYRDALQAVAETTGQIPAVANAAKQEMAALDLAGGKFSTFGDIMKSAAVQGMEHWKGFGSFFKNLFGDLKNMLGDYVRHIALAWAKVQLLGGAKAGMPGADGGAILSGALGGLFGKGAAGAAGGGGGGGFLGLGGIASKLFGGGSAITKALPWVGGAFALDSLIGSPIKKIFGGIGKTVKKIFGFADGGDPPTDRPSIVGERGPELFWPKFAGTIIPNHRMTRQRYGPDFARFFESAEGESRSSAGVGRRPGGAFGRGFRPGSAGQAPVFNITHNGDNHNAGDVDRMHQDWAWHASQQLGVTTAE